MIQRKQTIFLILAIICTVVAMCLPVCTFVSADGATSAMYNLWLTTADGVHQLKVWPLFVILLVTLPFAVVAIFAYKNRMFQARLCRLNMFLIFGWYIVAIVYTRTLPEAGSGMSFGIGWYLPFISMILYLLARRGIIADEKLVKAADRLR